jgi:hypothetical protein
MSEVFSIKLADKNETKSYFYAVFTTSKHSVTASAICMFEMEQIMNSFHGNYKQLKPTSSPIQVPKPRPSECPSKLTYQHIMFSRKNILMENEITSEALVVETSQASRFISIDVDFQVKNYENKYANDVIFVGTGKRIFFSYFVTVKFFIKTHENIYSKTMAEF